MLCSLIVVNSKLSGADSFQGCVTMHALMALQRHLHSIELWNIALAPPDSLQFPSPNGHCMQNRTSKKANADHLPFSAFGGMVAFCVIMGDTIPSVIAALFPSLLDMPFLWLLTNRRAVIIVCTLCFSYPLSLYRDIAKV